MPWVTIPAEMLPQLSLFGIDLIEDCGDDHAWYHGSKGRMYVEKNKPNIWVDEIGDAQQLGATAILKQI